MTEKINPNENGMQNSLGWTPAKLIIPTEKQINNKIESGNVNIFQCKDIEIKHVSTTYATSQLQADNEEEHDTNVILQALVPTKYEGGLKIWECVQVFSEYILENLNVALNNKNVLDLGCGNGFIGIIALLNGARVSFQDYNHEVINFVTIPNVILNLQNKNEVKTKCKFYSGDWESFTDINQCLSEENKFDYILTSDVIYSPETYSKLLYVFRTLLKKNGKIVLAAKTNYVGWPSGTRQFEEFVKKEGTFKSKVLWKTDLVLKREILEFSFIQ